MTESHFTSKLPNEGASIFSTMSALALKHNAVNLSQGFPDFPMDERLKEFVLEAMDANQVQYAPMAGRLDLRLAIAARLEQQHGTRFNPETEITVTAGATQAIYTVISTVVRAGDEVILFDPAYDCYDPAIRLNGGKPVHLKLTYPFFAIDWLNVRENITKKTRLIVVNNPHNPSGAVWSKEDLVALEQILIDFPNVMVLSDEVYEHIQFGSVHQSVLKSALLRERSFVTYSFGKTLHVTGWKLGYCIAPEKYMVEFRKIHQFMVFCANNTIQYAVCKFLNLSNTYADIAPFFERKRDLFLQQIETSRFKVLPCKGTYFCLLDYSAISSKPDTQFAIEITEKYGVAVIPTSVFYHDKTDHKVIRICFAKQDETLIKAAAALCRI